ncbi:uncharacterized protein PITG_13021 [Phytophthora infestans T30-4]|uniref:Uncharacterized protein n=1 Tax=Phytophthora infestans (strain T30-4) TaxID=403677 RepID=D0NK40_PHYIT|nr:uncharacterized protein PITG_13021 [Phytophthora infestans T30-4]EEY59877.1 hypothetical protein PITG_13021 [Phytophthora infestans T30-4]|eukprot:XP_002900562.1 hypothetical protein PITG_13021 [Phytophthora infestans T30-4]
MDALETYLATCKVTIQLVFLFRRHERRSLSLKATQVIHMMHKIYRGDDTDAVLVPVRELCATTIDFVRFVMYSKERGAMGLGKTPGLDAFRRLEWYLSVKKSNALTIVTDLLDVQYTSSWRLMRVNSIWVVSNRDLMG